MIGFALKGGILAGLWFLINNRPEKFLSYAHIFVLVGATILCLLYFGGLKDGLRWTGILLVGYIIVRVIVSPIMYSFEDTDNGWMVPMEGQITQEFNVDGQGKEHHGIDVGNSPGTPIVSARAGVVSKVWEDPIYGLAIIIDHKDVGLQTLYAHNRKVLVKVGQKVEMGRLIALCGSSGKSTGSHLHFSIINMKDGVYIDPINYVNFIGGTK